MFLHYSDSRFEIVLAKSQTKSGFQRIESLPTIWHRSRKPNTATITVPKIALNSLNLRSRQDDTISR